MNLAKGFLKTGAVLITGALMLTIIIGGCGAKKEATAVGTPENTGVTTQQGQAELDKGLDQKMQSLDSALDKLDKSLGSL